MSLVVPRGKATLKYELVFEDWEDWDLDRQECNRRKSQKVKI